MKTRLYHRGSHRAGWQVWCRAFTLPEMFISMTLFMIVLAGVIGSHLYGLRMMQVVNPKMGASDQARVAISGLLNDVRSAKIIRIGQGSLATFSNIAVEALHIGNSIQVYPTLDTNIFIRYYWDSTDNALKRTTNGSSATMVLATSVSNAIVFTSEDCYGNILSNNFDNRVIGVKLEFYQIQYPKTPVGEGGLYDYYQVHAKITRRTIM